jgi:hypothetical protein
MITANAYNRIFFIKGSRYGTAFSIDVEEKQYLVTARHLFEDPLSVKSLKIFYQNTWHEIQVTSVGVGRGEIDVIVFALTILVTPKDLTLPASDEGIIMGQDVYFAGYPYMMWADFGDVLAGRPGPFIKKGTLSTIISDNGTQKFFVDAINNEGFSGAPLLFSNPGANNYRVAAVVASFKTEHERVIDSAGETTEMTVPYNTGFMLAYGINHVLNLIRANPIGHNI